MIPLHALRFVGFHACQQMYSTWTMPICSGHTVFTIMWSFCNATAFLTCSCCLTLLQTWHICYIAVALVQMLTVIVSVPALGLSWDCHVALSSCCAVSWRSAYTAAPTNSNQRLLVSAMMPHASHTEAHGGEHLYRETQLSADIAIMPIRISCVPLSWHLDRQMHCHLTWRPSPNLLSQYTCSSSSIYFDADSAHCCIICGSSHPSQTTAICLATLVIDQHMQAQFCTQTSVVCPGSNMYARWHKMSWPGCACQRFKI